MVLASWGIKYQKLFSTIKEPICKLCNSNRAIGKLIVELLFTCEIKFILVRADEVLRVSIRDIKA